MKRLLFLQIFCFYSGIIFGQQFSGIVKDQNTGDNIPGATIYIPDLKRGTITDQRGQFELTGIPKSTFLVQVKMLGYSGTSSMIDFSKEVRLQFELQTSSVEHSEVIITGSAFTSDRIRTSAAVSSMNRKELQSSGTPNLIEAVTQTPGVSAQTTGAGIAKPIIRGLGLSRVLIMDKGIRQEGQQWGEEHGPEIDQFGAEQIEILKGPSSLQYGSDALGGVINIAAPTPPASGQTHIELNSIYATNNKLIGNSFMATSNHQGFIARIRGSYKSAGSFSTPVEKVYNSCFNESSGELMLGLNKSWGFSHWYITNWNSMIGLTEGIRDSLTGQFIDSNGNIVTGSELDRRTPKLPLQQISHFKASNISNIVLGKQQIKIRTGWQKNRRQEFEDTLIIPEKYMSLQTFTGDIIYYPFIKDGFETAIGISTMLQQNTNRGKNYIIPDFTSNTNGGFATIKKNFTASTFNVGIRFDERHMDWATLINQGDTLFTGNIRNFNAITGSIGMTHSFNQHLSLKFNAGKGFRSPSAPELTSNGIHEGTFRYEIGNQNLNAETSLQIDLGMEYEVSFISVSVAGFINKVKDFIYFSQENNEQITIEQKNYPVFRYKQGNALLQGGELSIDFHPATNIHFENSFSIVEGDNKSTETPLPFIPPLKTSHELRYDFKLGNKSKNNSLYIKIGADYIFTQKRIDPDFETITNGYLLLKSTGGLELNYHGQTIEFFITATNLTNTTYYNHLSRYKSIGVNGMGRNFTFGFHLPLSFEKQN